MICSFLLHNPHDGVLKVSSFLPIPLSYHNIVQLIFLATSTTLLRIELDLVWIPRLRYAACSEANVPSVEIQHQDDERRRPRQPPY